MNQYQVPILPEYKSMYVDMGLSEIATIERDRYDKASAENDQLTRTMGSIRLLNGDKQVIKDAEDRVRTMIGSSGKFQFLKGNVDAAVTDFATDHDILYALDSKAAADKEDEYANQLRAKGIEVPFNMIVQKDPKTGLVLYNPDGTVMMKKASELHNTKTQGIYKPAVEERLNYQQEALTLMSGIAESGGVSITMANMNGLSPTDIGTWVNTGGKGVSRDKKNAVAKAVTDEYIQTAAGNQLYRVKTLQEVDPMTGMLKTDAQARKEIQKSLEDWAEKQVGWVSNGAQQVTSAGAVATEGGLDETMMIVEAVNMGASNEPALETPKTVAEYGKSFGTPSFYNADGTVNKNRFNVNTPAPGLLPGATKTSDFGQVSSAKKVVALGQEVSKNGVGSVNWKNYTDRDVMEFAASPEGRAAFPKRDSKQTDQEHGYEFAKFVKQTKTVHHKLLNNTPAGANLILSTLQTAKIFTKDSETSQDFNSYTSNASSPLASDAQMREAIQEQLGLLAKGEPSSLNVLFVPTGKNKRKLQVKGTIPNTIGFTGNTSVEFYVQPVKNMDTGLAISESLDKITTKKKPGVEILSNNAAEITGKPAHEGLKLFSVTDFVESVVPEGAAKQRMSRTLVQVVDSKGIVQGTLTPEQVINLDAKVYEEKLFHGYEVNPLSTIGSSTSVTRQVMPK